MAAEGGAVTDFVSEMEAGLLLASPEVLERIPDDPKSTKRKK